MVLVAGSGFAQTQTVSGIITDTDGETLIGVNVMVKGTALGTISDFDGKYRIDVAADATLVFTFIGFKTIELPVDGKTTLDVTLPYDVQGLDEVVVVGYGAQKKSDLTGAVESVKSEDLERISATNPAEALQGQVAGVSVTRSSGTPGGSIDIKIRGVGTVGNNSPLYIIDGLPGSFNLLNPNDIASIEVLKDGAAAAIYGSRAANGVIIITTKQGKNGEVKIDYDGFISSVQTVPGYDLLDSKGYQQVHSQMYKNAGKDLPDYATAPIENNTNWVDEVFQTGFIQQHNLRISGGSENAKYSISGNFADNEGTVIGTAYRKNGLRASTQLTKGILKLSGIVAYSETKTDEMTTSLGQAYHISPLVSIHDSEQKYGFGLTSGDMPQHENPVGLNHFKTENETLQNVVTNFSASLQFTDWLSWRSNVGYRSFQEYEFTYYPDYMTNPKNPVLFPYLSEARSNWKEGIMEHMLNFDKTIGKHGIKLLAGATATTQTNEWTGASAEGKTVERSVNDDGDIVETILPGGFIDKGFQTINGGSGGTYNAWGSNYTYNRASFLGRVNYSFDSRYLFQFTMRRDGSSKFGKARRWGNFPSASVAWRVTEEDFMQGQEILSNLKIRASWGVLGNEVTLGYYGHQALISQGSQYYSGGYVQGNAGNPWTGATSWELENRDLQWEQTESINMGVDFAVLKGKLFGSFNYYQNTTTDMLIVQTVPFSSGVNDPTVNVGEIKNNGIELALTYAQKEGAFKYRISGNIATLKNEVVALADAEQVIYGAGLKYGSSHYPTQTRVGNEIGAFFLYQADGIFQNEAEVKAHASKEGTVLQPNAKPGDIRFTDVNEDGIINEEDRVYSGSGIPALQFGLNLNASYKGFDMNLLLQGATGFEIYNGTRFEMEGMDAGRNFLTSTLNAWTPENTATDMPRAVLGDPNQNNRESTRFLEDGDYLRLKSIQIGYTLPKNLLSTIRVDRMRFFASAQNLFVITKYSGLDPEFSRSSVLNTGVDTTIYPQTKSYVFGVQLSF